MTEYNVMQSSDQSEDVGTSANKSDSVAPETVEATTRPHVDNSDANDVPESRAHDHAIFREGGETNVTGRISSFVAAMHLMKGNLGPGCLNLPHAFAVSGWLLGLSLFFLVATQGIYSMILLAECKQLLSDQGIESHTFMDVALHSLGSKGKHVVQCLLFVLQVGVCCVFLSLLVTNLRAELALSNDLAIIIVTGALLIVVLLKQLKDLRSLSTSANILMMTAILTAASAGIRQVLEEKQEEPLPKAVLGWAPISRFLSVMFFSFEGIGLVLPVENGFTVGYHQAEQHEASQRFRSYILPGSMGAVGLLFLTVGLSASMGFPDIKEGSITAFLEERYPENPWYGIVNNMVIVAVFFTFPLQLTPAMEVLDEWCHSRPVFFLATVAAPQEGNDGDHNDDVPRMQRVDSSDPYRGDALLANGIDSDQETYCVSWCHGKQWILQRYLVVLGCSLVVALVDDLATLMSLFGAIGQTGLAAMPCICHLALQRKGLATKHKTKAAIDIFIIAFSGLVMISGVAVSIRDIYETKRG